MKLAEEVCVRWPADGRGWAARGLSKLLVGDVASANSDLERAIAAAPGCAPAWRGLGWAQILSGDLASAERSFLSALQLNDRHSESHGGLAVSLVMQQREIEAKENLLACHNLDAESPAGAYTKGLLANRPELTLDLAKVLAGSGYASWNVY